MIDENSTLEEKILNKVENSTDGIKPSEIKIIGNTSADIRSAALALIAKGKVEVGHDWKMRKIHNKYEEISSININGYNLQVGDKVSCLCEYQVVELYPVWHSDTKKHWIEHPNNSFIYKQVISQNCILHYKR